MHHRFLLLLSAASALGSAHATTPAEQLAGYTAAAGSAAQPARGQRLFTTQGPKDWSCASCHGAVPTQAGKHAGNGTEREEQQQRHQHRPLHSTGDSTGDAMDANT